MDIVPCYSVASRYTEPNPVAITLTDDQGPKGQAAKADESNLTSHSALDNTIFHFPLRRQLISAAPMLESKILATHWPSQSAIFLALDFLWVKRVPSFWHIEYSE